MNGTNILIAVLFGAVGLGYFMYGKKQSEYVFLISGIILMVYPYFVESTLISLIIGLVASIAPFKLREYF